MLHPNDLHLYNDLLPEDVRDGLNFRSKERLMKIGIVGGGVVGKATARVWVEYADVKVYDVLQERRTHSLESVLDSEMVFVCLPTPAGQNGACNTSIVEEFFTRLSGLDTSFALRSTMPIGKTAWLRERYSLNNLIHYPEFLTARCAATDAHLPTRHIVGGFHCRAKADLIRMLERRFPGVPIFPCTLEESEATKLFTNSLFAIKIAAWNELYNACLRLGLDFQHIRKCVLSDGRIAHSHTNVPGPDGRQGFGGTCLPKDLANLTQCLEAAGLIPWMLKAAAARNQEDRK